MIQMRHLPPHKQAVVLGDVMGKEPIGWIETVEMRSSVEEMV